MKARRGATIVRPSRRHGLELVAVDLRTMTVIKRLPTESKPNGIAYAQPFRKVYVVNTTASAVSVVDVDKDEVVKVLRFNSETGTPGYDAVRRRSK